MAEKSTESASSSHEEISPEDAPYAYDLHDVSKTSELVGKVLKKALYRHGEDQHFVPAGTELSKQLLERLRAENALISTIFAWSPAEQSISKGMRSMDARMGQAQETCQRELEAYLHEQGSEEPPNVQTVTNAMLAMKKRGVFEFVDGLVGNIESLVDEIMKSLDPDAIHGLNQLRDHHPGTGTHSVETGLRGMALAKVMGCNEKMIHEVGLSGFLHDLGKLMIPLSILDKNGRLTREEFDTIKSHALFGGIFFSNDNTIDKVHAFAAGAHHEAYTLDWGYGILSNFAKEIALEMDADTRAKAWEVTNYLAISDVWTALGEPRSYHKKGKFEIEILMIMVDMMRQKKFHPFMFRDGFFKLFRELPQTRALLRKGIHFPLFSFPKQTRDVLESRFELPEQELKLSIADLDKMNLWRMVTESGVDRARVERQKGITVHELHALEIMVTPKRLEQAGVVPKKVDYRIVFTKILSPTRAQCMLIKIDDTPLELQERIRKKDGPGLDTIQRYLFQKVGQFELDMSSEMGCPDDAFLNEIESGFV